MEKIISDSFAKKYANKKTNWGFNGLGYIVYKRTYARLKDDGQKEEWHETIQRCINGAQKIGADYTQEEAERLFDHIFNLRCNYAGRMLWQLGTNTIERFGANSLLNCWNVSMNETKAFLFLFENLMLGGGVGFSIRREDIHELPKIKKSVTVTHECTKDAKFIVPDSREGWIELLDKVLNAYYVTGKSFNYSTILIRGAGEKIQGFGGQASGAGILIEGIDKIVKIFQMREGKKLRSVDVLDICNIIGSIVVSGNVRRCLPENTLVHTKEGLIQIKHVVRGVEVLTTSGYKAVNNVFKQGKQKTLLIKTQDGEFECTPNHKMAVMTGLNQYKWVEAQNLQNGDKLITTRESCEGIPTCLPSWQYDKPKHSTTCQDLIVPILDEDVAWFIGLFQADGYTYPNYKENGFNAYVSLVFGEQEYNIAEKAKQQLEKFGLTNVTLEHRKNENSWIVRCQSKQAAWYFDKFVKQAKTELRVPDYILQAKQAIKLSYVSGLLDGDGSANNKPVIVVTTAYKQFAKEVQALLYSCGIESRIGETKEEWESRPSHWQKLYFVSLISLHSKFKLIEEGNLLKDISVGKKSSKSNNMPKEWVLENYKFGPNKNINVDAYERVLKQKLSYIPVEVVDIALENSEVETYDIEVEEKHEFFANGYLTHNSAQIALGDPDDYLFLRAKNWSLGNIPNWRAMSNNTIYADDFSHISNEIWQNGYTTDKETGFAKGEPYGFFNLPLSQKYGRIKDGLMKDSSLYPTDEDNVVGTNPCGEISLASYECCNLSELYLNNVSSKEELIDCAKLLYKTQKAIAALPFIHEETNKIVHKNMRLGLGVTGVCQSLDKVDWLDDCYKELRKFDKEWSKQKGWSRSIKLTTVKPSGTLSLLGGATPGVHPAYSKYYIRRVRMASNDPLVQYCRDMGYHTEYVINFDGSENHDTVVVEFPCETPDGAIFAADMGVVKQLETVKKLQTIWSDNAVSVTAYYSEEELPELKKWLEENYEKSIKSVSFLLRQNHGFKQAPYEEIDKETYEKLKTKVKQLKAVEFDGIGETALEGLECEGGACPIK